MSPADIARSTSDAFCRAQSSSCTDIARLPILPRFRSQRSDRPPNVVGDAGAVIPKTDTQRLSLAMILGNLNLGPNKSPVGSIHGLTTRVSRRG